MIYFVAGSSTMTKERAEALGLDYAMDGSGPSYAGLSQGPEGQNGVVFTFGGGSLQRAGEATWERIHGTDVWVGFDPDAPPGPAELERKEQLDGHYVELGDGRQWLVPVARFVDGSTPLPRRKRWAGGEWALGDVLERHRVLWEQANRVWDTLAAQARDATGDKDVSICEGADIACMAIMANYRLDRTEVSHLGLMTTSVQSEILLALVDWQFLIEFKKKEEEGDQSSTLGGEGS